MQEFIQAIKEAKTAGQLFFATGGRHINTDEFFKAKELKRCKDLIAKKEEEKKHRASKILQGAKGCCDVD